MNKILTAVLAVSLTLGSTTTIFADDLQKVAQNTDKLYRRGKGSEDGAFTSMGASMLAWGAGLGLVIALVCVLIQDDNASSAHSNSHCH